MTDKIQLLEENDPLRRLRWQCRRGLLELDVLLGNFLETRYLQLSAMEKAQFTQLLQYPDQQLWYWLTNQDTPPADLGAIISAVNNCHPERKARDLKTAKRDPSLCARDDSYIPPIISYIGLGSNLNQPVEQIRTAILSLQEIANTHLLSVSHFYQTTPIGFTDQPDFINAVACLKTQLSAQALLVVLQAIEKKQGRVRNHEKNGPRVLDLDLLLYGKEIIAQTDCIVPHPRLQERAFVLIPLLQIAPDLILPDGKRAQDCLSDLGGYE